MKYAGIKKRTKVIEGKLLMNSLRILKKHCSTFGKYILAY